jgi:hypothetical protein
MSGLGDLFGNAEARAVGAAADARLSGDAARDVHGRVRRAHARRAALRVGLAAVAVIVVGAGVVYGLSLRGTPPVAASPSGTASTSASASAAPSASPSDSGIAWPGFIGSLTTDPHLPDAQVITPEVWASAGPGWALVSYREEWSRDGVDDKGPQVIYLVSPQGDRYELVNVPGDTVSVLAWEPGSTLVPVSVTMPSGEQNYMALDLVTGGTYQAGGYAPHIWSLAFLDADGNPVWRGNDATAAYISIAPDGVQSDYQIPASLGAAELAEQEFGPTTCTVEAPFDAESSLVRCAGSDFPDLGPKYIARVSTSRGSVDLLYQTDGENGVGTPFRVASQVVAPVGGVDCVPTLATLVDGGYSPIPGAAEQLHPYGSIAQAYGAAGSALIWGTTNGCSGEISPIVVVNSNLETDDFSVLIPYPTDRPKGEDPYQSVTGVAVAR